MKRRPRRPFTSVLWPAESSCPRPGGRDMQNENQRSSHVFYAKMKYVHFKAPSHDVFLREDCPCGADSAFQKGGMRAPSIFRAHETRIPFLSPPLTFLTTLSWRHSPVTDKVAGAESCGWVEPDLGVEPKYL